MRSRLGRTSLMLVSLGMFCSACSSDDAPGTEVAPADDPQAEPEPEPDAEPEPEPEPECSFLECVGDVPDGVDGVIGVLIPNMLCPGTGALVVSPEDTVQGDRLVICMPSVLTREAPYDVTLTGPNGVIFAETRETPAGIPRISIGATPDKFPVGAYRVRVTQVQDFLVDESLDFVVELATSPRLLGEQTSNSSVRIWITGEDSNASVDVDFYVPSGQECVYRGTETIETDSNGVGAGEFPTDELASGSYFAFSRSLEARVCNLLTSNFTVA